MVKLKITKEIPFEIQYILGKTDTEAVTTAWRRNVKRLFKSFLVAAAIFLVMAVILNMTSWNGLYCGTLISGMHMGVLSRLTDNGQMEDVRMQIVYQLARRSIVKVVVKDSAGSGIVWEINDDNIVIASSKHLLMKDVKAQVTFCNGECADAEIMGYSQQYDVGFLKIDGKNVTANILRDIYEAVLAEGLSDDADMLTQQPVLQIGADLNGDKEHFSTGTVLGIAYEPVFNTKVLKTNCYSRAGMSGGGVFDATGCLLGMLSGGEVSKDARVREAQVSYSLPVSLITKEYGELNK